MNDDVLAAIRTDADIQTGSARNLLGPVEARILPHFDFAHMTRLAVGTQWRQAMLWVPPRGAPVWGRDAVMRELTKIYQGAWKLEPEIPALKRMVYGDNVVRVVVPIRYTVSATVAAVRYLVQQTYVRTPIGWRIAAIVPVPLPAK